MFRSSRAVWYPWTQGPMSNGHLGSLLKKNMSSGSVGLIALKQCLIGKWIDTLELVGLESLKTFLADPHNHAVLPFPNSPSSITPAIRATSSPSCSGAIMLEARGSLNCVDESFGGRMPRIVDEALAPQSGPINSHHFILEQLF